MGRHCENHRFLKTILIVDDQKNVIQRHEMDENGRLVADPDMPGYRERARVRRRPAVRFARQSDGELSPNPIVKLKADADIWSPVLTSFILYSTLPERDDDLIPFDSDMAGDFALV